MTVRVVADVIAIAIVIAVAMAISCAPRFLSGKAFEMLVPAGTGHGVTALFVSGDSGLRFGMSHALTRALAAHGIGVLGVNSATVFAHTGTRAEVDAAVEQAIRRAAGAAGTGRLVVIGQSFGADMLATSLPNLPADLRRRIAAIVLVVPGRTVFYRADPIGLSYLGKPDGFPAQGMRTLDWAPVTCIRGDRETDSLCPELANTAVTRIDLPGGHFLNRDEKRLVSTVLDRLRDIG